jgi:prepilin-type N-terminal cleavage/methylation domain-containing protein
MAHKTIRQSGFSLVELAVVVVIIGLIASMAIPRLSRGSKGAAEGTLRGDLKTMRNAIELFRAEHQGLLPSKKEQFVAQMTQYTDIAGNVNDTRTAEFCFGPYLRSAPPLPVGKYAGDSRVADGGKPGDKNDGGWWYDEDTGDIRANLKNDEVDEAGVPYNQY